MSNPAADLLLTAVDVCRGVSRLLVRAGVAPLAEVPLGCGRRADIVGIDVQGRLTLVEIKVSLADLRGDRKWPEYLDYCDRFFWAVPAGFPLGLFDTPDFAPARCGLIVADRFDDRGTAAGAMGAAQCRPAQGGNAALCKAGGTQGYRDDRPRRHDAGRRLTCLAK